MKLKPPCKNIFVLQCVFKIYAHYSFSEHRLILQHIMCIRTLTQSLCYTVFHFHLSKEAPSDKDTHTHLYFQGLHIFALLLQLRETSVTLRDTSQTAYWLSETLFAGNVERNSDI